jgi:hypothetical protein
MVGKRRSWISRQFAARPMRVLSLAARRALDRIEIEHTHHCGAENGKLPITYADFERFGLHPNAIAPAIANALRSGSSKRRERATAARRNCEPQASIGSHTVRHGTPPRETETGPTNTWRSRRSRRRKSSRGRLARASIRATSSAQKRTGQIQNATLTFRELSPSEKEGETKNSRPHIARVQAHPLKVRVHLKSRVVADAGPDVARPSARDLMPSSTGLPAGALAVDQVG